MSGTKIDQETLEACQSPYTNALSCLSSVPATDSSLIQWDQPPACRPHAHQCKCSVRCSHTDTDHAHVESLITFVETPCQEHTDALNCCCCCKATFVTLRFFVTSRGVLGSAKCWRFHRVHPATTHDVCSRRQVVLVHLFEDFHALQQIELFLMRLLHGSHCHILVSLEETLRRRLGTVAHLMTLLEELGL